MSADGKQIGLGTDVGGLAMCYRTDLFKKAGLPTDRDAVSKLWPDWDSFINVGKQYVAKTGKKFVDSGTNMFNPVLAQQPVGFYDTSEQLQMDGGPKAAFDVSMKAIQAGLSANLASFQPNWDQGFKKDQFAVLACPAWMLGHIQDTAPDQKGKWDIAAIPGGGGNWGGSYLAIPKASKHQQAAYDLIKWLTAPEQQVAMWKAQQHFPSSSTAAADPTVATATDTYFDDAPIGTIFNESATNLVVPIIGPKDGAIKNAFTQGLVSVEQQGKDPAKAWDQTMSDIDAVVNG
jgi:cellobiose transport system substrate-binding protein